MSQFENEGTLKGKPENIVENIVKGAVNKWANEISLLGQVYVKDSSLNIEKYLQEISKENASPVTIEAYFAFERGGLEAGENSEND